MERLAEQIRILAPLVEAIQALRGVSLIVATTIIAEIGDIGRFDKPRQLMAYLGLVPSEHSSGETIKGILSREVRSPKRATVMPGGCWW